MAINARHEEPLEVERYELREPPARFFAANRREFVQVLGAGLVITVSSRRVSAQRRGRRNPPESLSDRFHVGVDGVVTVFTGKVEVGQGSRTQLTQAAAEELRLPADRLRLVMADTRQCPNDGGTAGSRTTPSTVPRVRAAAATLREVLLQWAARKLSVDPDKLPWSDGKFRDPSTGAELTLAELAQDDQLTAVLNETVDRDVAVRPVEQWDVLGTSLPKIGGRDVVQGAARYPSDIQRPGMLHGKVLRPISFGATLESIDLTPAQSMPGVTVVRDGDFVGCVAENSWLAAKAVEAIAGAARWRRPAHPSSDELYAHLKQTAGNSGSGWPRPRVDTWGDFPVTDAAARTVESVYHIAYIQHAPMEPRAAVAEWEDGKLTAWTGSQQPMRVRGELMDVFRLPEQRVRVIVPDTGGGFGGKHTGEAAVEAARLAQAVGKPVSLRWTRAEEFSWAYCRPAGLIEAKGHLAEDGRIQTWDFTNYNSGGSAIETPYRTDSGRTRFLAADSPLRQGSYRALASTANTFARESMMDELAHAAGVEPLEFRLRHLPAGRVRDVLLDATRQFRWGDRKANQQRNRGIGLACGTEKGSFVAACAEVEVASGKFSVRSICQAYECGAIQNPENLRAQVAGCIIMGLGGALYEEMVFNNGIVASDRFSAYRVPRMQDVPPLNIVLRDRPDLPSVGAGETPIIAIAPAIANAVFDAVGARLRSLPLKSAELSAA